MWSKRDWQRFFHTSRPRWDRYRPPRPVDLTAGQRVVPAEGFSLRELEAAGISVEQAQTLGLPVDAGRIGYYAPNVSALRDFLRATRIS